MRTPHWLSDNRKGEIPVRCVFFDTETLSEKTPDHNTVEAKFWFGFGAYIRRKTGMNWTKPEWIKFYDPNQFWDWATSKSMPKTRLYIFAHNVGFDASVSKGFGYMIANGWKPEHPVLDDPPTIITYHKEGPKGRQTVVILDTLNYFRIPLAVLGKSVGVHKLEMPSPSASIKAWDTYCKQDVLVLVKAFLFFAKFIYDEDLGNFAKTLPSQAMAAFKHRFKPECGIYFDDNEEALQLSRDAYHGGRVEMFRKGHLPFKVSCLDINSMYPAVMSEEAYPMKLVSVVNNVDKEELNSILQTYGVVAEVRLNTNDPMYAVQFRGKLVFPVGEFETVLTTPELKRAIQRGHLVSVGKIAIYEMFPIFRTYVDFFWKVRKQAKKDGNQAVDYMSKLFLNSLYGKFGQTGRIFEDVKEIESDAVKRWTIWDADEARKRTFRVFYGLLQEESIEGESKDSLPAIAAHVTAYGRMYLWDLIETAGRENVFYCDTDSVFVNDVGAENLSGFLDDEKLGALKVEWESDEVTIRGNKDYRRGKLEKIKGIRANAFKIMWVGEAHRETFVPVDDMDVHTYRQVRFQGLISKIRTGGLDSQFISMVTKVYKRKYLKGVVDADGFIVPFSFKEGLLIKAHEDYFTRERAS